MWVVQCEREMDSMLMKIIMSRIGTKEMITFKQLKLSKQYILPVSSILLQSMIFKSVIRFTGYGWHLAHKEVKAWLVDSV